MIIFLNIFLILVAVVALVVSTLLTVPLYIAFSTACLMALSYSLNALICARS
jgi:hypothetical protein